MHIIPHNLLSDERIWPHPWCTHNPPGQEQVPQNEEHEGCRDEFMKGLGHRLPINYGYRIVVFVWCNYLVILYITLMSGTAVADGPVVHPGRSARTLKIHFTEPATFRFSGSSPTGRSAPEAGRSALGLGRCSLLHRTVRSVDLCLCSVPVRGSPWWCERSTARARTVRA
jgi:hypothetical protein